MQSGFLAFSNGQVSPEKQFHMKIFLRKKNKPNEIEKSIIIQVPHRVSSFPFIYGLDMSPEEDLGLCMTLRNFLRASKKKNLHTNICTTRGKKIWEARRVLASSGLYHEKRNWRREIMYARHKWKVQT